MNSLRELFPHLSEKALQRALASCSGSIDATIDYLLSDPSQEPQNEEVEDKEELIIGPPKQRRRYEDDLASSIPAPSPSPPLLPHFSDLYKSKPIPSSSSFSLPFSSSVPAHDSNLSSITSRPITSKSKCFSLASSASLSSSSSTSSSSAAASKRPNAAAAAKEAASQAKEIGKEFAKRDRGDLALQETVMLVDEALESCPAGHALLSELRSKWTQVQVVKLPVAHSIQLRRRYPIEYVRHHINRTIGNLNSFNGSASPVPISDDDSQRSMSPMPSSPPPLSPSESVGWLKELDNYHELTSSPLLSSSSSSSSSSWLKLPIHHVEKKPKKDDPSRSYNQQYTDITCPWQLIRLTGMNLLQLIASHNLMEYLHAVCNSSPCVSTSRSACIQKSDKRTIVIVEGLEHALKTAAQAKYKSFLNDGSSKSPKTAVVDLFEGKKVPDANEVDDVVTHAISSCAVQFRQTTNVVETAAVIHDFARAIAESPFLGKEKGLLEIQKGKSSKKTCSEIWIAMLSSIPKVTDRIAVKIAAKYPTLQSLIQVYAQLEKLPDSTRKCNSLLQDIELDVADAMLRGVANGRKLGPVASTAVYAHLMKKPAQ